MAFEFSKDFAQRWQALQGFERREVLGELDSLIRLLEPSTSLTAWQKAHEHSMKVSSVQALTNVQSSLFDSDPAQTSSAAAEKTHSRSHSSPKPLDDPQDPQALHSTNHTSPSCSSVHSTDAKALHAAPIIPTSDFELLSFDEDELDDAISSVLERWWRAAKPELIKQLRNELKEDEASG